MAAFYLPRLPRSPFDQTMALPYHLYVISTQVPGMPLEIQYGTALVLLVLVLSMNLVATLIRSYFRGGGSGERRHGDEACQLKIRIERRQLLATATSRRCSDITSTSRAQRHHGLLRAGGRRQDHAAAPDQPAERPGWTARTMTGTHPAGRQDIYAPAVNVPQLRRRVGMVFALPLPLPGTIRENVIYGPTLAGIARPRPAGRDRWCAA